MNIIKPPVFPTQNQDKDTWAKNEVADVVANDDSPLLAPPDNSKTVVATGSTDDPDHREAINYRLSVHFKAHSEVTVIYFSSKVNAQLTYDFYESQVNSYVKAVELVAETSDLHLLAGKNKVPDSEFWPR